jgi:phage terminase large subunit-like protein
MLDLFERYDLREAAYDPAYLERSVELVDRRLSTQAIFPVEPSSRHMREALQAFERGVLEGIVRHDGDPVLAEHLAWATADRGYANELRRVRKIDRSRPIDAVIAAALAYWRASMIASSGSVYDERGLIVV